MQRELAKAIWHEACAREGVHPDLLRQLIQESQDEKASPFFPHLARIYSNFQVVCTNVEFLTDIKMKIMHDVETLYGFDTTRAPHSNARRALTLLTKTSFVFRVRPSHCIAIAPN